MGRTWNPRTASRCGSSCRDGMGWPQHLGYDIGIWGSGVMVMERTDDDRCPDFNQQFSIVFHFFHLGGIPEVKSHREYRDLCKLMWGRGTSHQRIAWGPIGSQSPLEFSSNGPYPIWSLRGFIPNLLTVGHWAHCWGEMVDQHRGGGRSMVGPSNGGNVGPFFVSIDSLPSRGSHKKTWASFATEVGPLGPVGTLKSNMGLSENRVYSQTNSHFIGIMIMNHWV